MSKFTEVRVDELPWAWNPFKCKWRNRVDRGLASEDLGEAELARRFAAVACSLTPPEIADCSYHATDWKMAADLAIKLHRRGMTAMTHPYIEAEVAARGGGEREVEAVHSFWSHPIVWTRGFPSVGDGQHRICALKLAEAEWVLVELG